MANLKEIIKKADKWAIKEIDKYNGPPSKLNYYSAIDKGQELAKKLNADKDIVMIGCILMDIKLAECKSQGKRIKHCSVGAEATCAFLEQFKLDVKIKNKIIACIRVNITVLMNLHALSRRFVLMLIVIDLFYQKTFLIIFM